MYILTLTAAVHDIENGQKDALTKTMGEERIEDKNLVDGTDMNNKTGNSSVVISSLRCIFFRVCKLMY